MRAELRRLAEELRRRGAGNWGLSARFAFTRENQRREERSEARLIQPWAVIAGRDDSRKVRNLRERITKARARIAAERGEIQ